MTRRITLIDGGSGSGKTTFARQLQASEQAAGRRPQLVSLDELYPGWTGLAAASRAVVKTVLRGKRPGYRRWDWTLEEPADWVDLDPEADLIVEGCGALTRESAPLATRRIWIELDAEERKSRALIRDGDAFAPWWDVWAAQEQRHWQLDEPWSLADEVIRPTD